MRKFTACCLCLCFLFTFLILPAGAEDTSYSYPEPEVLEISVYIRPDHYLQMIGSEEKKIHPAAVSIDGGALQKIGLQVRGDSSLRQGLSSASKRIPMDLCFDYADPNGAFRGNTSLKLINCSTPARLVIQYVAMQAFVFAGVPTPRITPAFIRINDTDFGLYLAVEDLNESFVQNRFGAFSLYRPTTKKDDPLRTASFEGIEMLAKADHGDETLSRCEAARKDGRDAKAFLDTDEILRYMACEAFLDRGDGFLSGHRNFYLADDHGKLVLLPWDTDDVLTSFAKEGRLIDYEQSDESLMQFLFRDESCRAKFRRYVRELNDVFLAPESFLPWLESYIRALSPYYERDVSISMRSEDVFSDLTTGGNLYDTLSGDLIRTYAVYHDALDAFLDGGSGKIPDEADSADAEKSREIEPDRSVVFRICLNYRKQYRRWLLETDGGALIGVGAFFAAVFAAAVCSVYLPERKTKRGTVRGREGEP